MRIIWLLILLSSWLALQSSATDIMEKQIASSQGDLCYVSGHHCQYAYMF